MSGGFGLDHLTAVSRAPFFAAPALFAGPYREMRNA
jgi:hypothetical protein